MFATNVFGTKCKFATREIIVRDGEHIFEEFVTNFLL